MLLGFVSSCAGVRLPAPSGCSSLVSVRSHCLPQVQTTVAWFQQTPEGTFQIDNQFITGLRSPTGMTFAPDGQLFVTEQAGVVRVIAPGGQLLSTPFLTLSNVASAGERGLLGLALNPDFTSNGYMYIFYTPNSPALSRLSRVTANGDVAVASSLVTLLEWPNSYSNHRGGDIHFGPDGKLYLAVGDAGAPTNAQTVTSYNGKVLRLNKDGSVPSDNPTGFTDTSGATLNPSGPYRAIWAIGLRNPYRFAFDGATGAMRINDVGGSLEETNVGRAGRNYGWPTCQGGACSNAYAENPAYAYTHSNGCAITGGAFYRVHSSQLAIRATISLPITAPRRFVTCEPTTPRLLFPCRFRRVPSI